MVATVGDGIMPPADPARRQSASERGNRGGAASNVLRGHNGPNLDVGGGQIAPGDSDRHGGTAREIDAPSAMRRPVGGQRLTLFGKATMRGQPLERPSTVAGLRSLGWVCRSWRVALA
jgi:hypothetical protein